MHKIHIYKYQTQIHSIFSGPKTVEEVLLFLKIPENMKNVYQNHNVNLPYFNV